MNNKIKVIEAIKRLNFTEQQVKEVKAKLDRCERDLNVATNELVRHLRNAYGERQVVYKGCSYRHDELGRLVVEDFMAEILDGVG